MSGNQRCRRALISLAIGFVATTALSGAVMGKDRGDYIEQAEFAYLAVCGRNHEEAVCSCSKDMIEEMINPFWFASAVERHRGELRRDPRLGALVGLSIELCAAGE